MVCDLCSLAPIGLIVNNEEEQWSLQDYMESETHRLLSGRWRQLVSCANSPSLSTEKDYVHQQRRDLIIWNEIMTHQLMLYNKLNFAYGVRLCCTRWPMSIWRFCYRKPRLISTNTGAHEEQCELRTQGQLYCKSMSSWNLNSLIFI